MTTSAASPRRERLLWLDMTRALCALMILGIHWLRACYNVGSFGTGDPVNLVMGYQAHSGGIRLFHYLLIAGAGLNPSVWLTNLIGVLGGFGWEAVSALVLVSGFSLALAQGNAGLSRKQWLQWYRKRAKRILVPFYLVAWVCLALYAAAMLVLPHLHGHVAAGLAAKLHEQFHTPIAGVILSHVILLDPYSQGWSADFFAPAWWFIPAILLAYAAYPFARAAAFYRNGLPLLCGSAALSATAFALAERGILANETWYYIVLQESFDFCLGIVAGLAWAGPGRAALDRALGDVRVFALALVAFAAGNIANWTPEYRPIADMLYGPSLVVMLVFVSRVLARAPMAQSLTTVDPYDLYLVHQPFAFPLALLAAPLLHGYTVFCGWIAFVALATGAAQLLSSVQHMFQTQGASRPARAEETTTARGRHFSNVQGL